jgi:hypothetical protein
MLPSRAVPGRALVGRALVGRALVGRALPAPSPAVGRRWASWSPAPRTTRATGAIS